MIWEVYAEEKYKTKYTYSSCDDINLKPYSILHSE